MGWFANRRARAARETGVEASGAFCRAAGRDERGPDVAAPAAGGSSAPQRNDVRGLTRLACGAIALLALSGVLAMEGCAAVSTDAENSAASEQAAAASASDVEYASFEEVAAAFDESALDLDYSKRDLDASYDASRRPSSRFPVILQACRGRALKRAPLVWSSRRRVRTSCRAS